MVAPRDNELSIDCFIAVDVDRTTLRSNELFEQHIVPALYQIAEEQLAGDPEALNHRGQIIDTLVRDTVENIGKSFDFLTAYNQRIGSAYYLSHQQLAQQLIKRLSSGQRLDRSAIDSLLAVNALGVLEQIEQLVAGHWGFITSGGDATQNLKLVVLERILQQELNLPLRAQVVSTEHKARDIDTVWRQADGRFLVPTELTAGRRVLADRVVMIDDKPKNLVADDQTNIITILVEQLGMPDDGVERTPLAKVPSLLHDLAV